MFLFCPFLYLELASSTIHKHATEYDDKENKLKFLFAKLTELEFFWKKSLTYVVCPSELKSYDLGNYSRKK